MQYPLSLSVLLGYNGFPITHYLQGITRLRSWPDGVCCSKYPHSHAVSSLFLVWRCAISSIYNSYDKVLGNQCRLKAE